MKRCPYHHSFGKDHDQKDDCDHCEEEDYHKCSQTFVTLKKQENRERYEKRRNL